MRTAHRDRVRAARPYRPLRKASRIGPRPKADTYPVVKAADAALPEFQAALLALFARMARELDRGQLARMADVATPTTVASWVAPTVVQKATIDLDRLYADVFGAGARAGAGEASGLHLTPRFDVVNQAAVDYAAQRSARMVAYINDESRQAIANIIARAQRDGLGVDDQLKLISQLVGLTPQQAGALYNYRQALTDRMNAGRYGEAAARALGSRARISGGEVGRGQFAFNPWRGEPLNGRAIDRLVREYAGRQLAWRAEMIARTETMMAANAGRIATYQTMISDGTLAGATITRTWSVTHDDRLCAVCAAMDGKVLSYEANTEPTLTDIPWESGADTVATPPLHPACRCVEVVEVDYPDVGYGAGTTELERKAAAAGTDWANIVDGGWPTRLGPDGYLRLNGLDLTHGTGKPVDVNVYRRMWGKDAVYIALDRRLDQTLVDVLWKRTAGYLDVVPNGWHKAMKGIAYLDQKQTFGQFGNQMTAWAQASQNRTLMMWREAVRDIGADDPFARVAVRHEYGHLVDNALGRDTAGGTRFYFSQLRGRVASTPQGRILGEYQSWRDAVEAEASAWRLREDKALYRNLRMDSGLRKLVLDDPGVTTYGRLAWRNGDPREAFAEAWSMWLHNKEHGRIGFATGGGRPHDVTFRELFPTLDALFTRMSRARI